MLRGDRRGKRFTRCNHRGEPAAQRVRVVGDEIRLAARESCRGAEDCIDGSTIRRVELGIAARGGDHFRTRQPEACGGQHADAVGRTGEDRRAAEHVAAREREHRHAGRAQIEERAQRVREGELRRIGLVQAHAAGCSEEHDGGGTLALRMREQLLQRGRLTLAHRAAEERCVLRSEQHAAAKKLTPADDDAIVVARRDAPAGEMRARPGRVERVDRARRAGIGQRLDALRGRARRERLRHALLPAARASRHSTPLGNRTPTECGAHFPAPMIQFGNATAMPGKMQISTMATNISATNGSTP